MQVSVGRGTLAFGVVVFGSGTVLAVGAALSVFYAALVLVLAAWVVAAGFLVKALMDHRVTVTGDRYDLIALVVAVGFAFLNGALHHVSFEGQSDQGFYAADAYKIAQTGQRNFEEPFDNLRPGFETVGNVTRARVMFGYTSLAAVVALAGGFWAIPLVNIPFGLTTSISLYLVGRRLGGPLAGLIPQALYGASFVTIWLSRWILTENASTAVFWYVAFLVTAAPSEWSRRYVAAILVALTYGALSRPEGSIFAVAAVLTMIFVHRTKIATRSREILADPVRRRRAFIATGASLFVVLLGIVGFFLTVSTGYLLAGAQLLSIVLRGRAASDAIDVPVTGPGPTWGDYALRYEWESAQQYFLGWFLLVGVIGVAAGLVRRRTAAILAALVSPYLIFVVMPPVTTFHPYFMRRLWIAFVPLAILLAGATLGAAFAKKLPVRLARKSVTAGSLRIVAAAILAVASLVTLDTAHPFYLEREDDGSKQATAWLNSVVPPGDCIIADTTISGWPLVAEQLGGQIVIGFFNNLPQPFHHSFYAEQGRTCYLLRPLDADYEVMGTDLEGGHRASTQTLAVHAPPRQNHRSYLQHPPLTDGYDPLADYLREMVPPTTFRSREIGLELIRLESPIFLEKTAHLEPSQWNRTAEGLVAVVDKARVNLPLGHVSPDLRDRVGFRVHVVFGGEPASFVRGRGAGNATMQLQREWEGDGFTSQVFFLSAPVVISRLEFPVGTVLRGVMIAE